MCVWRRTCACTCPPVWLGCGAFKRSTLHSVKNNIKWVVYEKAFILLYSNKSVCVCVFEVVRDLWVCMCVLLVCLLLHQFAQGLSRQHEKWTAILQQIVFCCGRFPHLIQAVIEEKDLRLMAPGTLSNQHVAWVWVAVDEAMDEDHFAEHFTEILWDLLGTSKRSKLIKKNKIKNFKENWAILFINYYFSMTPLIIENT